MTAAQVLGAVLVAVPLVGLVALSVSAAGWRAAAAVWGVSLAATAALIGGLYLLLGGWQ